MNETTSYWSVILSIAIAMCLRIIPLPSLLAMYNPDWVLLVLIYWAIILPERVGIFHAWAFGLLTDVLMGRLFGQHALAYSLIIYICLKLHKRLRHIPLFQQALFISFCLFLSDLILFLIKNSNSPAQLHVSYWLPVISGTLCWPLVYGMLRLVRPK